MKISKNAEILRRSLKKSLVEKDYMKTHELCTLMKELFFPQLQGMGDKELIKKLEI